MIKKQFHCDICNREFKSDNLFDLYKEIKTISGIISEHKTFGMPYNTICNHHKTPKLKLFNLKDLI